MFFKFPFPFVFVLLLACCICVAEGTSQHQVVNQNNQLIYQVVKQAVEYDGWLQGENYQDTLAKFYSGKLLDTIVSSVAEFRETNTDWYSLTFLENYHIVYNNGSKAVVAVVINEVDINNNDAEKYYGYLTLHKTDEGWRITNMEIASSPSI